MYILIMRTIILYFFALLIIRLMGKRQIGELQPFELVITVMISELATLPMQDIRIPLTHAIIPSITLLILQISLAFMELKSEKARIILSGKPSILIEHGKINIEELKKQKININDLLEEIRLKDFYNLEDIEYAILETSGQVSIIPKAHLACITKEDIGANYIQEKLPITLILDGKINKQNLTLINKNNEWLIKQLQKNNISKPGDVFLAIFNTKGNFYYQLKERKTSKK